MHIKKFNGRNFMEDSKKYTSEYFSYHRNTIILFILCIITTVFGAKVDVEKLGPVSGMPIFISTALPFFLWISAIYHWVLFHAEWKECAEPHRTQIEDALDSLNGKLRDLTDRYSSIRTDLSDIIDKLNKYAEPSVVEIFRGEIERVEADKLDQIESIIRDVRVGLTNDTNFYQSNIKVIFSDLITKIDKIIKISGDGEPNISNIHGTINSCLESTHNEIYQSLNSYLQGIAELVQSHLQAISKETSQMSRSLRFSVSHIQSINENSSNVLRAIESYIQNNGDLEDVCIKLRQFSDRKRIFLRAKTDFAGISIPIIFFSLATGGLVGHYFAKFWS